MATYAHSPVTRRLRRLLSALLLSAVMLSMLGPAAPETHAQTAGHAFGPACSFMNHVASLSGTIQGHFSDTVSYQDRSYHVPEAILDGETQQSLNADVSLPLRPLLGSWAWYGKATGSGALVYNRTHSYEDAGGAMVFDTENYSGSGPIEQRDDRYITLTVRNAQQCQFRLDVPISIWGVNIYRAYNDEVLVEGPLPYPYPTLSFTVDLINLTRSGDTVTVTSVESVAAPCRAIPHQEQGFWTSFFQDYHCNYNGEPNGGSASISVNLTGTIAGGSEPPPVTLDSLDLPEGATVADGSPARIVATLRNPGGEPVNAQLRFRNSTTGRDLPGCPAEVVVPPTGSGAPLRVACDWTDTARMAWADDDPSSIGTDHTIEVQLTAPGRAAQSRQATLAVRPRPVVLVPGIAGTYSAAVGTDDSGQRRDLAWLMQRGVPPELLTIDPLIHSYDGILQTLANTGYVRADGPGKNLYVANYDWRLVPGPTDRVYDGVVSGLSAPMISDEQYTYGVDYLGRVLREAAERWQADYGVPLDEVDVIAHSTGGLVTRTYIQSEAYGGVYDAASDARLPRIAHFISVGVPHRGASKAWNPLHDNWGIDPSFQAVLSKIANRAFQKVDAGVGSVRIPGPDYDITLLDVRKPDGSPDPETFIRRYIPTINALLATYPFLDRGNGALVTANDGAYANHVLLDLNNGADAIPGRDPNGFLDLTRLTVIAGVHLGEGTPVTVRQRFGPADDVLAPFTDFFANDAEPGELFFEDVREAGGGDGTVPLISAAGQFLGDSRATVLTFTEGVETRASAGHVKLTDNPDVQRAILTTIGAPVMPENLAALGRNDLDNITSIILDPVQGYLVDGQGRRLGWSEATGPLQEIPNSVWSGAGDGFGLIFGPVAGPLRLELRGMDGPYYAQVTRVVADGRRGGVTLAGPGLTRSETVSAPAPLAGEPYTPQVRAGGPYTVAEGGGVQLVAAGDAGLIYTWDLDGDGSFETAGQSASFSAAGLDGPARRTAVVRGALRTGQSATASAEVTVENLAPTARLAAPASAVAGQPFALRLDGATDPGGDPLQFAFDCGQGLGPRGASSSATCTPAAVGELLVRALVADDDGGAAIYSATVRVTAAPGEPPAGLYRARQQGQRVLIERNVALAGLGDHDPDRDGWALVGRTNGARDNGELRGFYERDGIPYAIVFNRSNNRGDRCILLTPRSLGPVERGQVRLMNIAADPTPCQAP